MAEISQAEEKEGVNKEGLDKRTKESQRQIVQRRYEATKDLLVHQCSHSARIETEEAIQKTTPWPFPFSLLQMGRPEAERKTMLAEIEKTKKACEVNARRLQKEATEKY